MVPVVDKRRVNTRVRLYDDVFGGDHSANSSALLAALSRRLSSTIGVIAAVERIAIAARRVVFRPDTDFASFWERPG
jgi:hypothetical protein